MIETNQGKWHKRISDQQEEYVKQVLLEVEGKSIKSLTSLINQVIIDQIAEEGSHQHIDQKQYDQF